MKLFGKGRKKSEDSVIKATEVEEVNVVEETEEAETEEVETEESVEAVEVEESDKLEESLSESVELPEIESEEIIESKESEEVETQSQEMGMDITEKSDLEKTLEELDEEVAEEVRRTALLPIEEVNEALDGAVEPVVEPTPKALKRKRIRKMIMRTIGGILGTVLLIYLVGTVFFHYNFFYNTTVNGTEISFQSVKAVHAVLKEEVNNYELTMITSEGSEETISGNLINMGYKESKDVATALDLQVAYKWPIMFFKNRDFKIDVELTFNEDILVETLSEMDFANPLEIVEPVNAYPSYQEGNIIIVEEVYGNHLIEGISDILIDAVYNLEDEIVLMEVKAYEPPTYTSDSQEVEDAVEMMHKFMKAEINYNEGDKITKEQIGPWLKVNVETLEVGLDGTKVEEFVSGLEEKYNTYSNTVTFTNPVGKKATVTGGSYGYRVNKTTEAEQILADIKTGESVTRDIKYSQKGSNSSSSSSPFGDTYVCLDLTLQKVYLLYKGSVILNSDCVTGNVAAGMATPQGVYTLTYKTKNAVLRGDIQSDGSYGYQSPVSYWMPFNGGIGFHDASWRSTYGGTIYKTNGSHGCVNMPLANAAKLYEYINTSMPIVCHY